MIGVIRRHGHEVCANDGEVMIIDRENESGLGRSVNHTKEIFLALLYESTMLLRWCLCAKTSIAT